MNDLTTEENAPEHPGTPDGSRKQFRPLRAWPAFLLALLMLATRFGPGISDEGAAQRALTRVDDWQELKQMIESARKKENPMPKRVAQFWLPAFLTLLLSMLLLAVSPAFGPNLGSTPLRVPGFA